MQYRGADNTLMEQPEGRQGQSTLDTSASQLGLWSGHYQPSRLKEEAKDIHLRRREAVVTRTWMLKLCDWMKGSVMFL